VGALDAHLGPILPHSVPRDATDTFAYPVPFSTEFWRRYAEPLDVFLAAAMALREAMEGLRHMGPPAKLTEDARVELRRKQHVLHALQRTARSELQIHKDGRLGQHLVATSLLGAFAKMLVDDVTIGGPAC
jgi:hypothetical protein